MRLAWVLAMGLCGAATAQEAAQPTLGVPRSAVVVLDRDELFAGSLFGRRVTEDIDAATIALAAENRRLEVQLEEEERQLTRQRAELDAEAFRELAAAFDARVTDIRRTQDAKARAVQQQGERAQQLFLERANPILIELARETGALVILDRRIVIASADQVDITDLALARIDEVLGEGAGLVTETPAPVQRPEQPVPATPALDDADPEAPTE
ncbi:MAG: OmpH family outer membrane protein [Pseudomonadota bacterium]